jgi:4-amino-4-deoxy-L-arabinose transferase-like glycosyltransferase
VGHSKFAKALLFLCALLVAAFWAGDTTSHQWSSRTVASLSSGGIDPDGWIRTSATLEIPGLSSVGNFVDVAFNPARPGSQELGQVGVAVCGGAESLITVSSNQPMRFGVPNGCGPIRIALRGINFFTPQGEASSRQLNVQISRVAVSSPLGFPIADGDALTEALVGVSVLVGLTLLAVGGWGGASLVAALGTLVVVVCFGLFSSLEPKKFVPLWFFAIALLMGAYVARPDQRKQADSGNVSKLWLFVAVALGVALRFYGINFGLPSTFHPDEVPKVNAIMRMVDQNTWDPQYFLHPSLLLYCTYGMNSLIRWFGIDALFGITGSFRDTAFLAGRVVSATAGTLSIVLTYEIARRLFTRRIATWSALLLAVFPLHVTCSRYLKEDSLLTFVILSCVLTTVVSVTTNRRWLLLLAGFFAGCTAGAKYSGILMVAVPCAAPWLVSRSWKPDTKWLPYAFVAAMIAPLGFVCTTPYAILNSTKFIKDFSSESRHMQTGHTQSIDAWSQLWMYHFWRSIKPGMTLVTAFASIVGLGFLLRRRRIEDLLIVGLAILFYMPAEFVKAKPAPQPERYILPCLPFLAIALSAWLNSLRGRGWRNLAVTGCLAALVIAPLVRAMSLASEIKNDTRDQMAMWMRENLPPGAKVLMDWSPYCPRFYDNAFTIEYIPRAHIIPKLAVSHLKGAQADYLILSSLFYDRYFKQPESNPILRQRIREVFDRVPVVMQMVPENGTYGFHNPVLTLFSLKKEDFEALDQEIVKKRMGEIAETSNDVRARGKW